jgi:hypothetical protein
MSTLNLPPCPPWCRHTHGRTAAERRREAELRERHHSTQLGHVGLTYVDLGREDDLDTGQAGPVGLCVGSDGHLLTVDDVRRYARLVLLGGDVVSGALSLEEAQRRGERIAADDTLPSPLGAPPAATPAA